MWVITVLSGDRRRPIPAKTPVIFSIPRSLADLLAVFRPCFTAPTFPTFVGLLVGLIAQTRRQTVCGMLTGAGLERVWHHGRAHRLFANAAGRVTPSDWFWSS